MTTKCFASFRCVYCSATLSGRSKAKQRSVRWRKRVPPAIAALKRSVPITRATPSASKKRQLIQRRSPVQRLPATCGAELEGNRLFDVSTLSKVIADHTCCSECGEQSLQVVERFESRRGMTVLVMCKNGWGLDCERRRRRVSTTRRKRSNWLRRKGAT